MSRGKWVWRARPVTELEAWQGIAAAVLARAFKDLEKANLWPLLAHHWLTSGDAAPWAAWFGLDVDDLHRAADARYQANGDRETARRILDLYDQGLSWPDVERTLYGHSRHRTDVGELLYTLALEGQHTNGG